MAAAAEAEKFTHSQKLFTRDDSKPVFFQMRPCEERRKLKPMIEHGGGRLTVMSMRNAVKLAEKGSTVTSDDYISTKFIEDCVKENKYLDTAKYRYRELKKSNTSTGPDSDSSDDMEPAAHVIKTKARNCKGRIKYTKADDMKIINYIIKEKRHKDVNGKVLWKDMELLEITNHSFESMRTRFQKHILPHIDSYDISNTHKSLLSGDIHFTTRDKTPDSSKKRPWLSGGQPLQDGTFDSPDKRKTQTVSIDKSPSSTMSYSAEDANPGQTVQKSLGDKGSENKQTSDSRTPVTTHVKPQPKSTSKKSSVQPKSGRIMSVNGKAPSDTGDEDEFDMELMKLATEEESITAGCDLDNIQTSADLVSDPESTELGSAGACDKTDKPQGNPNVRHSRNTRSQEEQIRKSIAREKTPDHADKGSANRKNIPKDKSSEKASTSRVTQQEEHKRNSSSKQDSTAAGPSPAKVRRQTARSRQSNNYVDYVLAVDDIDTQQGMSQSPPRIVNGHISESDSEAEASDSEVTENLKVVEELCNTFGLEKEEAFEALWLNNGSVKDAVHWINNGVNSKGELVIDPEDDAEIDVSDSFARLKMKYGEKALQNRALFLEGFETS